MSTIFGAKLKELRVENSLTQKSLAEKLSITVSTLSHWECNYQEPALKDLILISSIFGVSTDFLLGLEDEYGNKQNHLRVQPTLGKVTAEEKDLIKAYRELGYYKKELIKSNIKAMLPSEEERKQKKKGN